MYLNTFLPAAEERARTSREKIATALGPQLEQGQFPAALKIAVGPGESASLRPEYTVDRDIQTKMEKLFGQYRPDYAAFVAMEADTGRIISLVSYSPKEHALGNLALRSSYPAASLFKIVTAAAAIDSQKAGAHTMIPFNGGYHTLYRRNVNHVVHNRWTREMTMKEAFAKSVNTVFAKLGLFFLDPMDLKQYAKRFRFNEAIASDLPIKTGKFFIPGAAAARENSWALAEIASGFNRYITLSPLQGAMMAAAVVNDGQLMEPYIVERLLTDQNQSAYTAEPVPASYVISAESSRAMREMMEATVRQGTSRKSFRTLVRGKRFPEIEIGGKTGSLTGNEPRGKYDWFVGYASGAGKKIALAALTINERTWKVKSSYVARHFIERYFAQRGPSSVGR